MIKISVIIPVYNVDKYIDKCLRSVISQSYKDFEVVLVDDGSTDNSAFICDEYSRIDERIRVFHKENGGLSSARNKGIYESRGEYLSFVDSDDWIEYDMLEKMIGACIENHADIAVCGRYKVDKGTITNDSTQFCQVIWNRDEVIVRLLSRTNIDHSVCDKLFRKALLVNLKFPEGKYYEDMFITVRLLYLANKVVHIGESKYYYLNRKDSITHEDFSPSKLDYYYACLEISRFIDEVLPELKKASTSLVNEGILVCVFSMHSNEIRKKYSKIYKNLIRISRNQFINIIHDKNVKPLKKLVFTMICINIYPPIKKIRSLLGFFKPKSKHQS